MFQRRVRGAPQSDDYDRFINLLKGALAIAAPISAASHPALAAFLPVAAEALNQVQSHTASRRAKALVEDVAEDLYFAQKEYNLTDQQIEQIVLSEFFNSALLQAKFIAARSHREEKRAALRNAVLNIVLSGDASDDKHGIFLALVDALQPVHLRALHILARAKLSERTGPSDVLDFLRNADEGLQTLEQEGAAIVLDDLNRYGFIRMNSFTVNGSSPFILTEGSPVTCWGRAFLSFITAPQDSRR